MDLNDDEIFLKKYQEEENFKKNNEMEKKRQLEDEEKRQMGILKIYNRGLTWRIAGRRRNTIEDFERVNEFWEEKITNGTIKRLNFK